MGSLANTTRVLRGDFGTAAGVVVSRRGVGHFRFVGMIVGDKSTFLEYVASGKGSVGPVVGYFYDQT
jgi:hypothetical protein